MLLVERLEAGEPLSPPRAPGRANAGTAPRPTEDIGRTRPPFLQGIKNALRNLERVTNRLANPAGLTGKGVVSKAQQIPRLLPADARVGYGDAVF